MNLPACLIGMEACGSAHHWARKLVGFGHNVKLMAHQFVKPYVKTNKNDAADAEAICEAVAPLPGASCSHDWIAIFIRLSATIPSPILSE